MSPHPQQFIAYFLEVPVDDLWSSNPYTESHAERNFYNIPQVIQIRGRIVGALIKQARLNEKLSVEELSQRSGMTPVDLEAIELGKIQIELPRLELVAGILNLSIQDFQNKEGIAGKWIQRQQIQRDFLELPEDIQNFVSKHENRPYLELAMRLSEMSAVKLRSIAESILEITY
jgi:transcriptional regulator with XRE-family HTH domain